MAAETYYLISSVVSSLSAVVAVVALVYSNRYMIKQSKEMFFAEYTKRYQDIILNMPNTDDDEAQVQKYMRLYFDLCSEEYHLYKRGRIPSDVWELWEDGMRLSVRRERYMRAWEQLKNEYKTNTDFLRFMVGLQ
ncbi:MAG: hypothetical protein IJ640_09200 [Prevotella sp.]|nr:hypothetical protein [Prevotella sp.]